MEELKYFNLLISLLNFFAIYSKDDSLKEEDCGNGQNEESEENVVENEENKEKTTEVSEPL